MEEKAVSVDIKGPLKQCCDTVKATARGIVSGMWIVAIVTQLITTAGNVAESAFLLATLWILINIAGHTLITWVIDAHTAILINNLCSIAFAALPELLFLGVTKTCIGHFLTAFKHSDKVAATWAILYFVPAFLFGIITVMVLAIASMDGLQAAINVGGSWLIIRYLSGLFYAIIHSIDQSFAKPHFASQMAEKDGEITELKAELDQTKQHFENALKTANENFQTALSAKQSEFEDKANEIISQGKSRIDELQTLLETRSLQVQKLSERASSLASQDLAHYPKVLTELINSGVKTVSVDDLSELTGISKRRIAAAKSLQRHSRNKDLIMVNSAIEWLKKQPWVNQSNGHGDTDPFELPVLTITQLEDEP